MFFMKKIFLILLLLFTIVSCELEDAREAYNKKEYLKSINYSNIADKMAQDEIKESLENAGVDSSNIDIFFKIMFFAFN